MNAHPILYTIRETPCFPHPFKLIPFARAGECWKESNSPTEYFPSREKAIEEIAQRGAELKDKS